MGSHSRNTSTNESRNVEGRLINKFQFEVPITADFVYQYITSHRLRVGFARNPSITRIVEGFVVGESDVVFAVEVSIDPDLSVRLIRRSQSVSRVMVCNAQAVPMNNLQTFVVSQSIPFKSANLVAGSDVESTVSMEKKWKLRSEASWRTLYHRLYEPFTEADDVAKIVITGSIFHERPSVALTASEVWCAKWQPSIENWLLDDLRRLMNDPATSDVEILVQNEKFFAHKLLLATRSSFFHGMFNTNMKESLENVVKLPEDNPKVFEQMLHYIYTDTCPEISNMAIDLLIAADKYDLSGLRTLCEESLMKTMNKDNVCDYLIQSGMMNSSRFYDMCIDFIVRNHKEVSQSDGWIALKNTENSGRFMSEIIEKMGEENPEELGAIGPPQPV